MLVKDARPSRLLLGALPLSFVLVVALAFFLGDRAQEHGVATVTVGEDGVLHRFLVPAGDGERLPLREDGLFRLELALPETSARRLQAVRDRALAVGLIVQQEEDLVPARVTFEGRELEAEVRIKGDWLDHVETDQWSLRIALTEPAVLGLRVFSVQALHTVGYLWEWVTLELARREGVLAPRSTFVHLVVNGNDAGVYFLQEHFAKELLESQRRREGPIVRWDESTHWDLLLQQDLTLPGPAPMRSALVIDTAPVKGFGEKRLGTLDALARGLDDAVRKMGELRELAVAARTSAERLRRMEAMEELREAELERVLNLDRLGCAHAIASLFQLEHPLYWHNMRFYLDPVLERLEPVLFDCMADQAAERDPVPLRGQGFVTRFQGSRAYYDGLFRHLGRLVQPGYVEAFLAAIGPELERFAPLAPAGTVAAMRARLLEQRDYLAKLALPADGVNFESTHDVEGGVLEVHAWATTRAPMVIEGFRFSNGAQVRARDALAGDPERASREPGGPAGAVVLPNDGRSVTFRFAVDERLASLASIEELKKAVRRNEADAAPVDLAIDVLRRPIASPAPAQRERLVFRRVDARWSAEGGRPLAPTTAEALRRHPFLSLDPVAEELVARAGEHAVAGDLVLPAGMPLRVPAGTRLGFEPGAVLLASGPLFLEGTADAPVVLAPLDADGTWCGVQVLEAPARSAWSHVVVRRTVEPVRHGWVSTGGVTFYRSPVDLVACRFEESRGEDALNVFAADVRLERCRFEGSASDSFDGDFVTGSAEACEFLRGAGDGLDLSGSDFLVRNSRFEELGDKAISAGERTELTVDGGLARAVSIGIAAKDGSTVRVSAFGIEAARHHSLAVFVKKPAFGPARIEAERLRLDERAAGTLLVQTGCALVVDGRAVPAVELDVERLYREGVLGR